ncbi:hypothetical protein H0261_21260 [Pectobacterium versatile]|nr:hypothetical protein [Pectobacterium versatile]MBA0190119.1 hypothetical protein [Pectobacterium odoriferum]MBN3074476.1 hypothetical protein [Pectobacterium brasiliense]MBN3097749.1 hypothetical protein [Pectobacterium brasiliense]MBN3167623.1 hypothetical protein [Pectobacterium brasiliense]
MVAQAGQPSGWPGPTRPVFLPPSGLPPKERRNSCGSYHFLVESHHHVRRYPS